MSKEIWKPGNMIFPLPAVLVTVSDNEGNDNVLTVAWTGTICTNPAMAYVSIRPSRHSYKMIKETGEFVKKITKFYFDFHWEWEHIIGCVINDPLAVAYFINPELCKGFDSYVQIETEGISLGQSVVDSMNFYRKAPNARVLTEVDVYGFFQMFLSRILDQKPEELDILQDLIRGDLK